MVLESLQSMVPQKRHVDVRHVLRFLCFSCSAFVFPAKLRIFAEKYQPQPAVADAVGMSAPSEIRGSWR